MNADGSTDGGVPRHFQSTLWTAVIMPAKDPTSKEGQAALETLCRIYWQPLYWHVRTRKGYPPNEAQDLTQSFFVHLLEHNGIVKASPERGRFRNFLLKSLSNFLISDWRSRSALKNGGGLKITSLEFEQAEGRFEAQPVEGVSPEMIYDKRWAMTLIDRAMKRLEHEYVSNEKGDLFAELKPLLNDERDSSYAEIAKRHGMTESAVGAAAHRLRKKFGEFLRHEVEQTVAPEYVDDELRYLISVWAT